MEKIKGLVGNRIAVIEIGEEQMDTSGIIMPDITNSGVKVGKVIAVSPDLDTKQIIESEDKVLFNKPQNYSVLSYELNDDVIIFIQRDDIIAVIE